MPSLRHSLTVALCLALTCGCGFLDEISFTFHAGAIRSQTTWRGFHRVTGDVFVHGRLVIDGCTFVHVDPHARIIVRPGGVVVLRGTPACPVTVRTSGWGTPAPGFSPTLFGHRPETATFAAIWVLDGARLSVSHVRFHHPASPVVFLASGAAFTRGVGITISF